MLCKIIEISNCILGVFFFFTKINLIGAYESFIINIVTFMNKIGYLKIEKKNKKDGKNCDSRFS